MAKRKKIPPITLKLTEEQKKQLQDFWKKSGSIGRVEVLVSVVKDKLLPTSIQVEAAQ
jgi:hypothetical protein